MKSLFQFIALIVVLIILMVLSGTFYVVDETEQVIITQFGQPVGEPIQTAGLYLKIPLIQKVNVFEKRLLDWDGKVNEIPTRDKKLIIVDTNARWRIVDPLKFLQSVGDIRTGQARLDDIIDSYTRDLVSSHYLVEVVRNSNDLFERVGKKRAEEHKQDSGMTVEQDEALEEISVGRDKLTRLILEKCKEKVKLNFGIELVDVRIKRITYVRDVLVKVYDRMISERKRAAEEYRSEGQGKKFEIEGQMTKELKTITSEAYKTAEGIMGEADAQVIKIYAEAFGRDPEFYQFTKTLETYKETLDKNVTILLSTDSEYFQLLKSARKR